jgi:tight adherence protein C
VEDFRVEQVVWGGLGLLGAAVVAALGSALAGSVNLLSAVLLCVAGLVGGVLGRDWWLTQQVQRPRGAAARRVPRVAELLALAVTAGESPTAAIARVTRLSGGELARELGATLGRARAGVPLVEALQQLADRTSLDALARFVDGLIVAIERGTPLAEVLRAQAADVREAGKRRLLEAGGRKEIAMMVHHATRAVHARAGSRQGPGGVPAGRPQSGPRGPASEHLRAGAPQRRRPPR